MRTIKTIQHGGGIDFWETPVEAVECILPELPTPIRNEEVTLLDPGAGTGAISLAAFGFGLSIKRIIAVESNPVLAKECEARFDAALEVPWTVVCDDWISYEPEIERTEGLLILGNPPYTKPERSIGVEFAEWALRLATIHQGVVALLFPLDFATGKDRSERIHDRYSTSVFPLRSRPHFGGPHSTGKRPFSWFVWDLGRNTKPTFKVVGN